MKLRIADYLSRWDLEGVGDNSRQFAELTKGFDLVECVVSDMDFKFLNKW